MQMQLIPNSIIAIIILGLCIVAPAAAGSFEDGATAYKRGDYATALNLFRPLAEQDDPRAQNNLGFMYAEGQGVPQDYTQAVKWLRLAADQGNARAQTSLGAMYVEGHGVRQNYPEAVKWYRLAADQGLAMAQVNLGAMYLNGHGVPRDYAEAVKWYHLAAEQGYADAQFALGVFYEDGLGVTKDVVRALMWYSVAAARYPVADTAMRDGASTFRDQLSVKLTPEQIAEAQKLAREWKPTARANSQ